MSAKFPRGGGANPFSAIRLKCLFGDGHVVLLFSFYWTNAGTCISLVNLLRGFSLIAFFFISTTDALVYLSYFSEVGLVPI